MQSSSVLIFCFFGAVILGAMFMIAVSIKIVPEYRRLSVYRLGRYMGDKGPGIVFLIPLIDRAVVKELGNEEKTPIQKFVGEVGETRTTVFTDGKVLVAGEGWDALSQSPISAGQRVRVVRLILEVEKE